jgi:medium-chain acyl-[acyl-carrier-protein] hydrolase
VTIHHGEEDMPSTTTYNAWIYGARPNPGARRTLFCFSHAGAGALAFRPWATLFPADIQICPVQLPGRENRIREPLFTQFDLLIQALAEALRPYFTLPFAFFGHSMGALVSFGLAQYLRRQGEPLPEHLFVSAYRAPQVPIQEPLLHQLPEADLVRVLLSLNGTRREVLENAELRQLLLPILRADFAICETYKHLFEDPLPCPISAFGGIQDSRVKRVELVAWREQTSNTFTLRMLPGGHFYLEQMQGALIQLISHELLYSSVRMGGQ